MLLSKFVQTCFVAFTLLFSANSQALIFNLADSYTDNSYLSDGTYSGSFDINALMTSTFGSQDYTINSGYINFSFSDDSSDIFFRNSTSIAYNRYQYNYIG